MKKENLRESDFKDRRFFLSGLFFWLIGFLGFFSFKINRNSNFSNQSTLEKITQSRNENSFDLSTLAPYSSITDQIKSGLHLKQLQLKEFRSIDLPDTDLATVGNPQGICTDGTYLYVTYRQHLYKILMSTGVIVSEVNTTYNGSYGNDNGDCCYYDGYIYIGTSNFRIHGIDAAIAKYKAGNLSFVGEYKLAKLNVPSTLTEKDGYFWVIRYTNPITLEKYTNDFSQLVKSYKLGNDAGDGIVWLGNYLLINQHEDPSASTKWGKMYLYYYINDVFEFVGTIPKRDLWGQGIDFDIHTNTLFIVKRGYTVSKNKIIYAHVVSQGSQSSMCRLTLSSNQSGLPSNRWTKIHLDTAGIDPLDDFDKKNARYIAPFDGYYEISYGVVWEGNTVIPNYKYSAGIAVDGGLKPQPVITSNLHAIVADHLTNTGTDILFLKAGQTAELYAQHTAPQTTPAVLGSALNTFLTIKSI